jgi:hypothetical protein
MPTPLKGGGYMVPMRKQSWVGRESSRNALLEGLDGWVMVRYKI